MTKASTKTYTIRAIVERSFIIATLVFLAVVLAAAMYFNQRSLQERRNDNLQKIHEILSNLITPVLNISDVTEIRRLLQLASSNDETFVVVDSAGNILMPDYTKLSLVNSIINPGTTTVDCQHLHTIYRNIDQSAYWINCSELIGDAGESNPTNSSILLSFSKYKWLFISPMIMYFLGIAMITMLLIIICFRLILYKKLLKPLITLGNKIVDSAKSPLSAETSIADINDAPLEVFAIKQSFENLLTNLQAEHKQRTESDKKAALLDLAAQVAHDIRSPLAVMEMALISSSKDTPNEFEDMQRQAIQCVRDIANNLLDRYREPNTLSNEHSNTETSLQNTKIHEALVLTVLTDHAVSQKRHEWANHPCEISYSIDLQYKEPTTRASPIEINRLLSNLLNNAYESLENVRSIKILVNDNEHSILVSIEDSGIGVPSNKIDDILSGLSLKHEGNGLGLSSAKSYMESIGGKLSFTSSCGRGTKVILSFPRISEPAENED